MPVYPRNSHWDTKLYNSHWTGIVKCCMPCREWHFLSTIDNWNYNLYRLLRYWHRSHWDNWQYTSQIGHPIGHFDNQDRIFLNYSCCKGICSQDMTGQEGMFCLDRKWGNSSGSTHSQSSISDTYWHWLCMSNIIGCRLCSCQLWCYQSSHLDSWWHN